MRGYEMTKAHGLEYRRMFNDERREYHVYRNGELFGKFDELDASEKAESRMKYRIWMYLPDVDGFEAKDSFWHAQNIDDAMRSFAIFARSE